MQLLRECQAVFHSGQRHPYTRDAARLLESVKIHQPQANSTTKNIETDL